MNISALPPIQQPQAQKLKRIVEGVGSASIAFDRFEDGVVSLHDASLPQFKGRFSGEVAYDVSTRQLQKVDLKCQLSSFATISYKLEMDHGKPSYERVMTQEFNERSQRLAIQASSGEWDYSCRLDNHGPFQPDYDEERVPTGPPVGA